MTSAASGEEGPAISAAVALPQLEVTGHGFLPGSGVLIRVTTADETALYFRYTADTTGDLTAALPDSIPHGVLGISATDGRPDPGDESGLRWTGTATVSW